MFTDEMKPEAIVVANSDQLPAGKFDRFISMYGTSKLIFLGNLSLEQTLRIHTFPDASVRLPDGEEPASSGLNRKPLLIAGPNEFNALQNLDQIDDDRYRDVIAGTFHHATDTPARKESGTRIHIRSLDMTLMYGIYGSEAGTGPYLHNRVDERNLADTFERVAARNKRGVICGHPLKPLAYRRDEAGAITNMMNDVLASVPIYPSYHYILAPGSLNLGYYAVISRDKHGQATVHFNQLEFGPVKSAIGQNR